MIRRYKLVIAYDGTNYSGYQLQENAVSVQQVLEEALTYLDRAPVRVFGCSRTDAGVHARGFVAHCDLVQPIPPAKLVYAMNARMPADVRVLRASLAAADFDARKSALGKEYRYFIYNAPILPPHLAPFWTGVNSVLATAFSWVRPWMLRKARKGFSSSFTLAGAFTSSYSIISWSSSGLRTIFLRKTISPILYVTQGTGSASKSTMYL
jgi:tRNA U38,U39,U40 pseudouridine synthase TruA